MKADLKGGARICGFQFAFVGNPILRGPAVGRFPEITRLGRNIQGRGHGIRESDGRLVNNVVYTGRLKRAFRIVIFHEDGGCCTEAMSVAGVHLVADQIGIFFKIPMAKTIVECYSISIVEPIGKKRVNNKILILCFMYYPKKYLYILKGFFNGCLC